MDHVHQRLNPFFESSQVVNGGTNPSTVYEWNGVAFQQFQVLPVTSGSEAIVFEAEGTTFLAFSDMNNETSVWIWENQFLHWQVQKDFMTASAKRLIMLMFMDT